MIEKPHLWISRAATCNRYHPYTPTNRLVLAASACYAYRFSRP